MDEPSMGLSPAFVDQVFDIIQDHQPPGRDDPRGRAERGRGAVIAHRGYVLQNGRIVMADNAATLLAADEIKRAYLGEA